jgi:hypothetical protein
MFPGRIVPKRPNVLPPVTLSVTGLVLIACSLIWPRVAVLHGTMTSSGVDLIQGFLLGIGIACEGMGIARMVSRRRSKKDPRSDSPRGPRE